jgi:hypothetical protein
MTNIELSGNLTIQSIQQAASVFLTPIDPSTFSDINQLYTLLKNRGTLTLKNAILILPKNDPKIFIGVHRLILKNSKIYCNSTDTFILCNEYEHYESSINSFSPENITANNGESSTVEGNPGLDGEDGFSAANVFCFTTDEVKTDAIGINVNLTGQNAGNGGNGKDGKKGLKGRKGRNCETGDLPGDCESGCGDGHIGKTGQKGGDAGDGGNGGNGGKYEFRLHGYDISPDYFFRFTSNGGKFGYAGIVGDGGEGGDGGDAGRFGCRHCNGICHPGPKGIKGQIGNSGNKGLAGNNNFLINSTFDVSFIKLFIHSWGNSSTDKSNSSIDKSLTFEFKSKATKNASL